MMDKIAESSWVQTRVNIPAVSFPTLSRDYPNPLDWKNFDHESSQKGEM
jgi:hypothetical protein